MSNIIRLIQAFIPAIASPAERDEAYLAESVDIYDLERRMREIDTRAQPWTVSQSLSAGLR